METIVWGNASMQTLVQICVTLCQKQLDWFKTNL